MKYTAFLLLFLSHSLFAGTAGSTVPFPGIAEKTAGMEKRPGFFTYYWDAKAGKIWLEIDKWDTEFLYVESLPAGVGSNDIGLDRGQPGESRVVRFSRIGPKVLLIQSNYSFRSTSGSPEETRSVRESFAESVLWGFDVAAEEGGRTLVDAGSFFLHDTHGVIRVLKETQQGDYKLDDSRSAFYLPRTKNFPNNSEIEVTLTFAGQNPGQFVKDVVPSPESITVREHHSLILLPDSGYTPRVFDPRSGFFEISFLDFSTPVSESIRQRLICRHRLQKKDPGASVSEAVEPILYYVDRGAPEPVRSALVEGASWWNQAFEAAGYKNAFRVELLPEDADPMDVRYNVIQWVHRATRGWSLGNAIYDPRTCEILKGQVTLGSQRVRQDFLIASGLLAPYEEGKSVSPEMERMALARIRQLAAHEVGHTLGLSHNYIASTNNRASVMDYPVPLVNIGKDGSLDLSNAYATGIGEWDKVSIRYGYDDFAPSTDERSKLNEMINTAAQKGLIFLTDQDARPPGSAHPRTHLWDNGTDPVQELEHVFEVRSRALQHFSEQRIPEGAPFATLEEVLVPVYLYHRYQIEAVAKVIGGQYYTYALRGDGQKPVAPVPPEEQRKAIQALLKSIDAEFLMLPERILNLIPPHPEGYGRTRETFSLRTGMTFDPLAAAETSAGMTVSLILHPERAARLVENHARDPKQPGLEEVINTLLSATWKSLQMSGTRGEIQRTVENAVLYHLMALAANQQAQPQSRAIAFRELKKLKSWVGAQTSKDESQRAHETFAIWQIERFEKDPKQIELSAPVQPPAGPPIGCDMNP